MKKRTKILLIVIPILIVLLLYILYVNLPRFFSTKNGEIVITDPPPSYDIDLASAGRF